jgi:hypothetical protein
MTIMATNNPDGVAFTDQDRRFTPVRNPEKPADATYFTQLNDWLVNTDWQAHVACYLKQRTLTGVNLMMPLDNITRQNMLKGGASELTRALMALRNYLTANQLGYITTNNMQSIIKNALQTVGHDQPHATHLRKALNDISTKMEFVPYSAKAGKAHRCRLILQGRAGPSEWATLHQMGDANRTGLELDQAFKSEVSVQIDALDCDAATAAVVDEIA